VVKEYFIPKLVKIIANRNFAAPGISPVHHVHLTKVIGVSLDENGHFYPDN
jgi:hypothetical protein